MLSMVYLPLSGNQFMGGIPPSLGNISNLLYLDLSSNRLMGGITPSLGNMSSLLYLDLSTNQLSGTVPTEIWKLPVLSQLDLSGNRLTGEALVALPSASSLSSLRLDNNQFTKLPDSWASLVNLWELRLAGNKFTGPIPVDIGHVSYLKVLDLSRNHFTGSIPYQFGNLNWLRRLSLSHNNLSGEIPDSLDILESLTFVDISFNNFIGVLSPSWSKNISAEGNPRLCISGGICVSQTSRKGLSTGSITGITVSGCLVAVVLITFVLLVFQRERTVQDPDYSEGKLYIWAKNNRYKDLTFQNLLDATVGSENPEILVSYVDRLPDWDSRYRIAVGTLEYLHCDYVPPILHRDVKSANILLDNDLEPHITDFGTTKFQDPSKSSPTSASVGTYGYIAPECGLSLQVNEKIDVYAFGVVLLELLMGRYVLDPDFHEGMNLVTWIETNIKSEQDILNNVLDSRLLEVNRMHIVQEMILVMKIAMFCIHTLLLNGLV
ncbi:hypothetical protein R1sor_017907 [Riccia sorocarpa]|uniref:Protein kinase domain-containing protein n=1 Tax=Riccia sorocarpa TaxID=122646 RepID=A0ABD3I853_9MARC